MFSPSELNLCADICCDEPGGTVELARELLGKAYQAIFMEACPDYLMMGSLLSKLILLSASRAQALGRIEEVGLVYYNVVSPVYYSNSCVVGQQQSRFFFYTSTACCRE